MSVRIRLTRIGSRKNPVWRVVVADQRSPRDGRVIETVGRYNPQTQPSEIVLDEERVRHWLARGAQPTSTGRSLIRAVGAGGARPSARGAAEAGDGVRGGSGAEGAPPQGPAAEGSADAADAGGDTAASGEDAQA